MARARGRGSTPRSFTQGQTRAYSRRSRTVAVLSSQLSVLSEKPLAPLLRTENRELRTLLLRRQLRPLGQSVQEGVRGLGRFDFSLESGLEGHHAAVEVAGAVFVLLDNGAGEFETGEETAGARVGQNLRPHFPIGISGGVAADGTGGGAGIGPEFELAGEQVIHAVLVHDEHDDI